MRQSVLFSVIFLTGMAGCQQQPPAARAVTAVSDTPATTISKTPASVPLEQGIPQIQLFAAFVAGEQHFQLFESINVQRPVFNDDGKLTNVVAEEKLVPTPRTLAGVRALNLDGSERDLQPTLLGLANQEPVLILQAGQKIHPAIQKYFPATMVVLEISSPPASP